MLSTTPRLPHINCFQRKIRGQEEPRILQLKIDNNRLKNELRTRKDEYGSAKRELEDLKSKKEEVIAKQVG